MTLRLVSLVSGIGLLVSLPAVTWWVTRSGLAMLATAGIAVLDDSLLYFATEARPFATVQLLAVWQAWFFLRWIQALVSPLARTPSTSIIAIALGLLTVAMFYLHYTAALFLAVEALSFLVISVACRRKINVVQLRTSVLLFVMVTIACVPGVIHLVRIASSGHAWRTMVDPQLFADQFWSSVLLMVIPFVISAVWSWLVKRNGDSATGGTYRSRTFIPLLVVLFAAPILASGLLNRHEFASLAMYRYNVASFVMPIIVSGCLVGWTAQRVPRLLGLVVMVLVAWTNHEHVRAWMHDRQVPAQRFEDWEQVCDRLSGDRLPVFLFPNLIEDPTFLESPNERMEAYYRFPLETDLYPIGHEQRYLNGHALSRESGLTEQDFRELRQHGSAWLVVRAWPSDAEMIIDNIRNQTEYFSERPSIVRVLPEPIALIRLTWNGTENQANP